MKNPIFRRDFLKFAFISLGALLASCVPRLQPAPEPTTNPTSTSTREPSVTQPPTTTATLTPEPTQTSAPTSSPTPSETPTPTNMPCFNLLTPENSAKLNTIGKVTFSWEAMPGAASYKIEIIFPTNQVVVFETANTSRVQYIEAFRMGGAYQWKVTAYVTGGAVICTSESFTFEKPEYVLPTLTKSGNSGSSSSSNGSGTTGSNGSAADSDSSSDTFTSGSDT